MPRESVRRALRRCALATVAVVFAATAAGRPFVAWGMAEEAIRHAARQAGDCSHQHHMPSHTSMPCATACVCCPPASGGGAPLALVPAATGIWAAPSLFRVPVLGGEASPRAAVSVRQPPAIGPPSARVA